jgi:hypothetical protein
MNGIRQHCLSTTGSRSEWGRVITISVNLYRRNRDACVTCSTSSADRSCQILTAATVRTPSRRPIQLALFLISSFCSRPRSREIAEMSKSLIGSSISGVRRAVCALGAESCAFLVLHSENRGNERPRLRTRIVTSRQENLLAVLWPSPGFSPMDSLFHSIKNPVWSKLPFSSIAEQKRRKLGTELGTSLEQNGVTTTRRIRPRSTPCHRSSEKTLLSSTLWQKVASRMLLFSHAPNPCSGV